MHPLETPHWQLTAYSSIPLADWLRFLVFRTPRKDSCEIRMVIKERFIRFFKNCYAYLLYLNQSSRHEVRSGEVFYYHRARGLLAGLRRELSPRSSPKSKTYSPFPARPAFPALALPWSAILCAVSALRTSGNVGSSPLSIARGLSFHHLSAVAAKRLLPIPKASPAVHRPLGSHLRRPLRYVTVSGDVFAKNLRSRLSARPDANPSLRQRISSGQPIADSAARSTGLGEPISLVIKDNCSIGVSPGRHGVL